MPIDPKHLLDLAKRLVGPAPGAVEADLRCGISTAYYALFHLLIKEAMTNFVSDPVFRLKQNIPGSPCGVKPPLSRRRERLHPPRKAPP
jgi:hypothetical protein